MNKKGFTLIELLIVFSLIAMLSVVVVPNIKTSRVKAREMSLKASVYKVKTLLESYYFDHGAYVSGTNITVFDLFSKFKDQGYVSAIPTNPYTGSAFSASDGVGKILYSLNTDSYLITAYKSDGTVLLVSDGTN